MKIVVFFPIWKRFEIVFKCVKALCKLKPKGIDLMFFSLFPTPPWDFNAMGIKPIA